MGIDFTVLYPTFGLNFPHLDDQELRRAYCTALNTLNAEIFGEYADRMTPTAAIPMHTPQDAIEELEYATNTLGLKAIVMAGHVRRPTPVVAKIAPQAARKGTWLDAFCLDSE